jgi:aminopeptidase N
MRRFVRWSPGISLLTESAIIISHGEMMNRKRIPHFQMTFLFCVFLMVSQIEAVGAAEATFGIQHHNLSIELNPLKHYLSAVDRITCTNDSGRGETKSVLLLLSKQLNVRSVLIEGKRVEFSVEANVDPRLFTASPDSEDVAYYQRAQGVRIPIGKTIAKKSRFQLEIAYQGFIADSVASSDFSREYIADQITAYLGAEGVYLSAEAIYYPAVPGKLFTFELKATVPDSFFTMSEGARIRKDVASGKRTEHWVENHPLDAFHLIAGPYRIHELEQDGVKIQTYFYAESEDLVESYLQACARYLALYDSLLGPYPFEKFAVVENFFPTGYGMPSFTLLGSEVIRLPFIIGTSLGHEVCHNWWGNSVYVDYASGNWCEGLTTYCADYLYKKQRSAQEARQYRLDLDRDYTAYTDDHNDFPLKDFRERHNPAQRAVGYGKSAMIFHMLERELGADVFWRALRAFYRDNVFQFGSWWKLRNAFEVEAGTNLGWFFDQWIDRTGAPQLAVLAPKLSRSDNPSAEYLVTFTISQQQPGEPYILDIPIAASDGARDTVLIRRIEERDAQVQVALPFPPQTVSVDPDFDLFRRLHRAEIPPTLAEIFGSRALILVLPSNAAPDLTEAYRQTAQQINREGRYRIVQDRELTDGEIRANSLFFLGTPNENLAIPAEWLDHKQWEVTADRITLLGESYPGQDYSFVAVERNPADDRFSVGFFAARRAQDVQEAGRKLIHYGKYSYLIFQGGKNQIKGVWDIVASPMTISFKGE